MAMVLIHLAIAALVLAIARFLRSRRSVHVVCAIILLAVPMWLGLGYAAAYRSVPRPSDTAVPADSLKAWFCGVDAMNEYTFQTYIPVFLVYCTALMILAILSPQATQRL